METECTHFSQSEDDGHRTEELCQLFEGVIRALWTKKQKEHEWTVAAAFVAEDTATGERAVLSAGFGTKCPGKEHYDKEGRVLHDCHAEVVARRALVLHFLQEIYSEIRHGLKLQWLERCSGEGSVELPASTTSSEKCLRVPQYSLRETATLTLLLSELPCGDAAIVPDSIESSNYGGNQEGHKAKRQKVEETPLPDNDESSKVYHRATGAKPLENYQSNAHDVSTMENTQVPGHLRLKPGRTDLPPRLRSESMSCTDKLTRWHYVGIQGALLSSFLTKPLQVSSYVLVLSPRTPYSHKTACKLMENAITHRRAHKDSTEGICHSRSFSLPVHRYRSENLTASPLAMAFVGKTDSSPLADSHLERDFPKLLASFNQRRKKEIKQRLTRETSTQMITLEGTLEILIGHRGLLEGASNKSSLQKVQSCLSKQFLFVIWALIISEYNQQYDLVDTISQTEYRAAKRAANAYTEKKKRFHLRSDTQPNIFSLWRSKEEQYDAFEINSQSLPKNESPASTRGGKTSDRGSARPDRPTSVT